MKPTAYEGKENYIFVSYAHSDRDEVFKVLNEFEKRGYRFWYDDGIAPGSEWPEDIAQHLNGSYIVMAFITPRAVASHNCRREINYALSQNKNFLSVILEPTEMSAGLEMQLSAQQSVIRNNYPGWDGFIKKLLSSPYIEPCLAAPEPEPSADGLADTVESASADGSTDPVSAASETAETKGAAVADKVQETAANAKASVDSVRDNLQKSFLKKEKDAPEKSDVNTPAAQETKKSTKWLPLFFAAVGLLVLAVLIHSLTDHVTTSWGESYKKNSTMVEIKDVKIQQEDIEKLSKIKEIDTLSITNCDLSGCDLAPLVDGIEFDGSLDLSGCTNIKDFSFLKDHSFYGLSMSGVSEFNDLSLIDVSGLHTLDISGTGVSDISALSNAAVLDGLNISETSVTDIGPLMGLEELGELNMRGCKIKGIPGKSKALELVNLYAADCGLSNLDAFSNCTILRELNISGNKDIKDLSWLNIQNSTTLERLNISKTGLDSEALDVLKGYSKLTWLSVDGNDLDNLDFCKNHSSLSYLSAQGCGLNDIAGLSGCKSLKTVLLSFNNLKNIGGLTSLVPGDDHDIMLDLSFNKLSDISKLPAGNYHTLLLVGNEAEDLVSTMSHHIGAYNLSAEWFKSIARSSISGSENIYKLYLTGVPDDQLLVIKDNLIKYDTIPVTMDELYTEIMAKDEFEFDTGIDFSYAVKLYKAKK